MKATCLTLLFFINYLALSAQIRVQPGKNPTTISNPSPSDGVEMHKPLYVVFSAGKIILKATNEDILASHNITPASIQSVTVLKDSSGIKKYGNDARYGVVEIQMKDGVQPKPLVIKNMVGVTDLKGHKPLYVVLSLDKIILKSAGQDTSILNRVDPASIQSINILKDSTGIKKYGGEAKYGVVEIKMKDGKYPKDYQPD